MCEEWIFENKSLNEKKKRKKVDNRVVILSKIKYYFVKIKNNNTHPIRGLGFQQRHRHRLDYGDNQSKERKEESKR